MPRSVEQIRELAERYIQYEKHPEFQDQIRKLLSEGNDPELFERFYNDLSFGTGGLRAVMGGGSNRLNCYTIRLAAQGLAQYISQNVPPQKHLVVLAYDSRNNSQLFACEAAQTLAANRIRTCLFRSLRPTPQLSYTVRETGACAGIVITASHNPAPYNGFKVYWEDGAQIITPHDTGIIEQMRTVQGDPPYLSRTEAEQSGLLSWLGPEADESYWKTVLSESLRPDLWKEYSARVPAVYTPLHGAGRDAIETVLQRLGLSVFTVPEQAEPDGNFPAAPSPNPETPEAMQLALQYAAERGAQIVLATDPDSDRIGIAIPRPDGQYQLISGNQLGAMFCDYIFHTRREQGTMPENPAFVNTIVTSNLQNRIAQFYGIKNYRVLTGFKYIAALIRQWEQTREHQYIFGCEESYGYLIGGTEVRDKDAVSAALLAVEMTLWNASQGRSLLEYLEDIYQRFGYYAETTISQTFENAEGAKAIQSMISEFRQNPMIKIESEAGCIPLTTLCDYHSGETIDLRSQERRSNIDLPRSNVLQFLGNEETIFTVRPSGTEPKIKFYISCASFQKNPGLARQELSQKQQIIKTFVRNFIQKYS